MLLGSSVLFLCFSAWEMKQPKLSLVVTGNRSPSLLCGSLLCGEQTLSVARRLNWPFYSRVITAMDI